MAITEQHVEVVTGIMMSDLIVIAAFWTMVLAPCVVALHASLVEDEQTLGYATSFRRLKAKLISTLRV